MFARYSQWANEITYERVAALPDGEASKPRETTFGNIIRTLGHSYAVSSIFQAHLEQRAHGFTTRNVSDAIPFDELRRMQREIDTWYVAWIDRLRPPALDEVIKFRFLDGSHGAMTRGEILLHVVNHSTFHRGFIIDMLRQVSNVAPVTDLPVFLRDHFQRHR
jgi:uncharacterized damage-inducible protein DinB